MSTVTASETHGVLRCKLVYGASPVIDGDLDGREPMANVRVIFQPHVTGPVADTERNSVMMPVPYSIRTDAYGELDVRLWATDLATGTVRDWTWTMIVNPGTSSEIRIHGITVAAGQVNYLADVAPTQSSTGRPVHDDNFYAEMQTYVQDAMSIMGTTPTRETVTTTGYNVHPDPNASDSTFWKAKASGSTASASNGEYVWTIGVSGSYSLDSISSAPRPALPPTAASTARLVYMVNSKYPSSTVTMQYLQGTASLATYSKTVTVAPNTYSKVEVDLPVPSGADNFRIYVGVGASETLATGDVVKIKELNILLNTTTPFTGATPDVSSETLSIDYSWMGSAGASQSKFQKTEIKVHQGESWPEGSTVAGRLNTLEASVSSFKDGSGPAETLPPTGFSLRSLSLPKIYQSGRSFLADVDEDALRDTHVPKVSPTWVSPQGSATASGSSRAEAKTLGAAIAAKSPLIYLTGGEYFSDNGQVSSALTTHSYALIAVDPDVRVTGYLPNVTWSSVGNGTYATSSIASSIVDYSGVYADSNKNVRRVYSKKATAAEVTSPGTWYSDTAQTIIYPFDDIDLTATPLKVRVSGKVRTGVYGGGGVVWAEGIAFEGGWDTPYMHGGLMISLDCSFKYSAISNGLNVRNADAISIRCDASGNYYDGFNYHESGGICNFVEIDCSGSYNGIASKVGNCNASTAHESVHGLRVGGKYGNTYGPILADVNDAQTWTLGASTIRDDVSMSSLPHVHADGAASSGDMASMWIQGVSTSGQGTSWKATNGAFVRLRSEQSATQTVMEAVSGTVTRMWG